MSVEEIQVFLPQCADDTDALCFYLRGLTKAIGQIDPERQAHGFLGGEDGYGAHWDNDVFLMHPYCWCEESTCKWCSETACDCANPAPLFYIDNEEVDSETYWRRNRELVGPLPHEVAKYGTPEHAAASSDFDVRIAERDRRWRLVYQPRKHRCLPAGLMADHPGGESWKPHQTAPNFWHKSSGLKVWWYKYIGRDMEVLDPNAVNLGAVFSECAASLGAKLAKQRGRK